MFVPPPTPHPRALSSNFRFIFCPLSSPDLFNFALDVAAQWELFWPVLWKWWRPGCSPPPLLSTSLKSSSVLWMEPASLAWLLRGLCIVSSKENFSSSRRPSVSSAFQQPNMWGIKGLWHIFAGDIKFRDLFYFGNSISSRFLNKMRKKMKVMGGRNMKKKPFPAAVCRYSMIPPARRPVFVKPIAEKSTPTIYASCKCLHLECFLAELKY